MFKLIFILMSLVIITSCGQDSDSRYSLEDCSNNAKAKLDISFTEGVSKYLETLRTVRTFDVIFGVPLSGGKTTYDYQVIESCSPESCIEGYKKIILSNSGNSLLRFICVKNENCVDKSLKSDYLIPKKDEELKELTIADLVNSVNSTRDECVTNPPLDILGCTDSRASNYNSQATQYDGSCECSDDIIYSEENGCDV